MADRDGEGNSPPELAEVGGAGESFGEGMGGNVGNWGDVAIEGIGTEGLIEGQPNRADSNGAVEVLPGVWVVDGVRSSVDRVEGLGACQGKGMGSGDGKIEEGEVLEEVPTLEVAVARANDAAGREVKVIEEKCEVEMVAYQNDFVERKGLDSDRLVVAAALNSGFDSGNVEKSMEKDQVKNYGSAVQTTEAIGNCCLIENVGVLGERNFGDSEKHSGTEEKTGSAIGAGHEKLIKDGKSLDSCEMGVAASDALEEHASNAEIIYGNTGNISSIMNVESLEGGVSIVNGGASETTVSGNIDTEQVIYENDQDYQVDELISGAVEFNTGEREIETRTEIHLTGSVDTEIVGMDNEMYFGPGDGGIEALEDNQSCFKEKGVTDGVLAVPNSVHMEVGNASVPSVVGLHIGDEMEVDERDDGAEDLEMVNEEEASGGELKTDRIRGVDQAVYQLLPDAGNVFAVSDLVWGKVRSHPWWPGQIFDPSDASEKAMEYHEKESFLVAYFGDHTFAWNEASLLKPFQSYFSSAVRQSSAEEFQNAVDCALEEVSRRVELGLACSCLPKDVVDEIKVQVVENVGIRPDSCTVEGVGRFADANFFKPYEFIRYVKALARSPSSGADGLELVIAKAQLLALYRDKGFSQLPEFQSFGDLVEDDAEALDTKNSIQVSDVKDGLATSAQVSIDVPKSSSHRRKHNLKDIVYHRRKERSLFELMDEAMIYSEDDEFELDGTLLSKRRRGFDTGADLGSMAKGFNATPSLPKPSFKIGACISRVASQMTKSPSLKSQSEGVEHVEGAADIGDAERGKASVAPECQSLLDLVSQLQSVAVDPMGGHTSFNVATSFFSDFRNSVAVGLDLSVGSVVSKRRKSSQYAVGSSEAFEFEDMKDSYWTDRTVGNGFEENPNGVVNGENQIISFENEKPRKAGRRPYTRRRDVEVSKPLPEKPAGYMDPNSPAELVLTFPEPRFIPSEVSLNKTFKRFGPLNVLQTELDRDGNRARVVFKKSSDAEIACGSASKFNIFGSLVVNYQLNYTLSDPFTTYYKPVPLPEASAEAPEDAS